MKEAVCGEAEQLSKQRSEFGMNFVMDILLHQSFIKLLIVKMMIVH